MSRALFAAMSVLSLSAHAGEAEEVFSRVRDAVVTITSFDERGVPDAEGSGIVIANQQVVTNCHVVEDSTAIKVKAGDKEFVGTLALADTPRDLCALDVPGLATPHAVIRSHNDVKVGERVFAIGNPLGFGLSVSAGLMSTIGQYRGEPQLYTSAALSPGSSGGGLFDADGRLVGITTRVLAYGQNVNVAIPAEWISELPQRGKHPSPQAPAVQPDPNWSEQAEALLRQGGKWAELLELARKWQLAYPTSSDAQAFAGLALFNLNRPSDALDVLVKATQANPKHATARAYLGLVRKHFGDMQAALEDLRVARDLNPSLPYPVRTTAEIFLGQEQLEQAAAAIREAILLDPGDDANWLVLGMTQHQQKKFDEAAKAYRTALRINPNSTSARENLAGALAAQGLAAEARETLAPLPATNTADARTWMQIGVTEYQKGRYGDAERAFRKALEFNPASVEAALMLARVLNATGRPAEAEAELRRAVKARPDLGDTWLELGGMLYRRGERIESLEALEKAASLSPGSGSAWRQLAYARRDKQDLAGAISAWEKVAQLEPTATDWAMLGESRLKLGRWDESLAALQEAERLDSKNEITLQALATFYGTRGDFPQSLTYIGRALEVNPASSQAWSIKGYTLLKLKQYAPASEALQTAVRLQPDNANAWINLGETFLRQAQLGKAIAALEQGCKLAPKAVDARIYAAQAYLASGQAGKAKEHLDAAVLQQPEQPMAWYMLTAVYISQGKQAETLDAYAHLSHLNPALARDLKEKMRGKQLPGGIALPE